MWCIKQRTSIVGVALYTLCQSTWALLGEDPGLANCFDPIPLCLLSLTNRSSLEGIRGYTHCTVELKELNGWIGRMWSIWTEYLHNKLILTEDCFDTPLAMWGHLNYSSLVDLFYLSTISTDSMSTPITRIAERWWLTTTTQHGKSTTSTIVWLMEG